VLRQKTLFYFSNLAILLELGRYDLEIMPNDSTQLNIIIELKATNTKTNYWQFLFI